MLDGYEIENRQKKKKLKTGSPRVEFQSDGWQ